MKLQVTMDNFLEAMKEVEPSAIREFLLRCLMSNGMMLADWRI